MHEPTTTAEIADIEFFIAETAFQVRQMPMPAARQFLRGLLATTQADALPELRRAYAALCESDAQLELIARQPALKAA
jgi:hypothetical protein